MNNTNVNENSNTELEEMHSNGKVKYRMPTLGWLTRFRHKMSISYLLKLEAQVIKLIGDSANEAIELEMIPKELTVEDKNGECERTPFMEARDIIMWGGYDGILLITRNFKMLECDDYDNFTTINLIPSIYQSLYEPFEREYENITSFPTRDFCLYATNKMIDFQKMIDKLFYGQPMDKVLTVDSISDLEIRDMLCDLYNIGLDRNAELHKIDPQYEFESIE